MAQQVVMQKEKLHCVALLSHRIKDELGGCGMSVPRGLSANKDEQYGAVEA
jgi:hypothetical protein